MRFSKIVALIVFLPTSVHAGGSGNPVRDDAPFPFEDVDRGKEYLAERFEGESAADGITAYFDDEKIHTWLLLEEPGGARRAIIRSRTGLVEGEIADFYRIMCHGPESWCDHLEAWHRQSLEKNPPPPPPPDLMDLL
ncbi:hypothetical protein [Chiayiivirga flava]|uniref:Uncharacterized protein n=1 Tax=Chiayiivirga flava TaxID=659595 RepID=A0A7W8G3B4_9GAMM|nr:hypothetical protein [Chiayiivirga flava]MBB5209645.1 hypothetical protein [Chiayiivirga flava]